MNNTETVSFKKAHQLITTFYGEISSPNSCDYCLQCDNRLCKARWHDAMDCAVISINDRISVLEGLRVYFQKADDEDLLDETIYAERQVIAEILAM